MDYSTPIQSMANHNPVVFFKRFLASPVAVGAVLPTSLSTARIMASPANPNGTVLEIGAGTGSITQGILEQLNDPTKLTSVELDAQLATEFKRNFPQVRLEVGDAEAVLEKGSGWDTIISGIPFAVMEPGKRDRMFNLVKQKLAPGGAFVAIQYSLTTKAALERDFKSVKVKFSPLNIPPAFIYVCREPIVA
jgi:phospholipid N-methyltransferase